MVIKPNFKTTYDSIAIYSPKSVEPIGGVDEGTEFLYYSRYKLTPPSFLEMDRFEFIIQ